jgi:hypothetical protein
MAVLTPMPRASDGRGADRLARGYKIANDEASPLKCAPVSFPSKTRALKA